MSTFHWRTDSRLEPAGGGDDDDDSNSRTLQNHNISRCVSLSLSDFLWKMLSAVRCADRRPGTTTHHDQKRAIPTLMLNISTASFFHKLVILPEQDPDVAKDDETRT